ncbi:MAG: DUF4340 domain-containing protein [Planctomycetaceae bacterium]
MTGAMDGTRNPAGGTTAMGGRTLAFVGVGAALLAAGWLALPRFTPTKVQPEAERVLFPELSDAGKAASLEIVSFDDKLATLAPFKVAQAGGVWVLPAHENYPADAKDQLAAAATELVDLRFLNVHSTSAGDHEACGVIEPDAEKIKVGMTGVGQLVEIRDAAGNRLARLIIGKEDKRPGPPLEGGRKLRFVRRAGQDPVYVVEIDTSKFTTRFEDWIEKDLLKLSPWDIRRVVIDDSSCSFSIDEASGRLMISQDRRGLFDLAHDDKAAAWSVVKLEAFDKARKPKPAPLGPDEELASGRLNDLKNALCDLKIIDVARKPAGLSGELRAEKTFMEDLEAKRSLAQRGFYAFDSGDIVSSDGETVVGTKDGVEYVLRFGNGTTVGGVGGKPDDGPDGEGQGEVTGRYLFVMARFNEGLLEKPVLEPVPEAPADEAAKDEAKKKDEEDKKDEAQPDAEPAREEAAGDDGKPAGAAEELAKADEAEAKAQAAIEERRRVERENRRKQEEYDEKVKGGQKRVRELNNRFADWYYVVSDAEYAKIHLDRAELVQKKPAGEAGPGADDGPPAK